MLTLLIKRKGVYLLTTICATVLALTGVAQDSSVTGEYQPASHVLNGDNLHYQVMYPNGFDESKKYPLVLFLHGAGERGNNNTSQLVHGSRLFRDSIDKYPAIVIFPQCPRESYWANVSRERNDSGRRIFRFSGEVDPTPEMTLLMDMVKAYSEKSYVNTDRIYVAGLSMGGMGTWEIIWRMPQTFAAAMPICGGGATSAAAKMVETPIWAFHGKQDDIVPPNLTVNMVRSVQEAGGVAKLTIYVDANHNSWDPAFAEPLFLKWMFSHTKEN